MIAQNITDQQVIKTEFYDVALLIISTVAATTIGSWYCWNFHYFDFPRTNIDLGIFSFTTIFIWSISIYGVYHQKKYLNSNKFEILNNHWSFIPSSISLLFWPALGAGTVDLIINIFEFSWYYFCLSVISILILILSTYIPAFISSAFANTYRIKRNKTPAQILLLITLILIFVFYSYLLNKKDFENNFSSQYLFIGKAHPTLDYKDDVIDGDINSEALLKLVDLIQTSVTQQINTRNEIEGIFEKLNSYSKLKSATNTKSIEYFKKSEELWSRGVRTNMAVELMQAAHKYDSNNIEILTRLSEMELQTLELTLAEKHVVKALDINPLLSQNWDTLSGIIANEKEVTGIEKASNLIITAFWFSKNKYKYIDYLSNLLKTNNDPKNVKLNLARFLALHKIYQFDNVSRKTLNFDNINNNFYSNYISKFEDLAKKSFLEHNLIQAKIYAEDTLIINANNSKIQKLLPMIEYEERNGSSNWDRLMLYLLW